MRFTYRQSMLVIASAVLCGSAYVTLQYQDYKASTGAQSATVSAVEPTSAQYSLPVIDDAFWMRVATSQINQFDEYTAMVAQEDFCYVCNLRSGSYGETFSGAERTLSEMQKYIDELPDGASRVTLQVRHDEAAAAIAQTQDAISQEWDQFYY